MRGSPLVYELEDPSEFCLDALTDSKRPGVQTALPGWLCTDEPEPAPEPTALQRLLSEPQAVLFVVVMLLASAVRWL